MLPSSRHTGRIRTTYDSHTRLCMYVHVSCVNVYIYLWVYVLCMFICFCVTSTLNEFFNFIYSLLDSI